MRPHKTYRGLHGEAIPVAAGTIATGTGAHGFGPFPFSAMASRNSINRDRIAEIARYHTWIGDAIRLASLRRLRR